MDFSRSLLERYLERQVVQVPNCEIKFCTAPSSCCDYTQHGADPNHHHAKVDRGIFFEGRSRTPLQGEWDNRGPEFRSLPEFKAVKDHFNGHRDWRESEYAGRIVSWMMKKKISPRGLSAHPKFWLDERLVEIEALYASIRDRGIEARGENGLADLDEISVNINRAGEVLFNNRGHHRLSICKILQIEMIPVQIVVMHELFIQKS